MKQINEYSIAVHEAGHAVMSVMINRDITEVTIIPNSKYIGSCESINLSAFGNPSNDNALILKIKQLIQYLFAGYIAEGNYTLSVDIKAFGNSYLDICKANELYEKLNLFTSLSNKKKESLVSIWKETVRIIQQPFVQQQIKAVADALMKHKKLAGSQVVEIMRA